MKRKDGYRHRLLQVRLTSEEYDRLKQMAVSCGIPVSKFVRERVLRDQEYKWRREVLLDIRTMRVELTLARRRLECLEPGKIAGDFAERLENQTEKLKEIEEVIQRYGSDSSESYQPGEERTAVSASEKCDPVHPESEEDG